MPGAVTMHAILPTAATRPVALTRGAPFRARPPHDASQKALARRLHTMRNERAGKVVCAAAADDSPDGNPAPKALVSTVMDFRRTMSWAPSFRVHAKLFSVPSMMPALPYDHPPPLPGSLPTDHVPGRDGLVLLVCTAPPLPRDCGPAVQPAPGGKGEGPGQREWGGHEQHLHRSGSVQVEGVQRNGSLPAHALRAFIPLQSD